MTDDRVSLRASARREMPAELRRDVRLLGELLGQVLVESGGEDLLADVERLRRTVIEARHSDHEEQAALDLVAGWSLERAEDVARAFTCYFHLANLAEEQQRARVLRSRDRELGVLRESLAATVDEIRAGQGEERLRGLLAGLELHPVLTAHPTEARRRAVVTAIRRIGEQLARLDDPRCSGSEERDARRRLLEEIEILWRTAQLRNTQLQPMDEVRATLAAFDWSLVETVPQIYRELDTALAPDSAGRRPPLAPAFVRFGTWVGGDRDGNPYVTAEVTAQAMRTAVDLALQGLRRAVVRLARGLTSDVVTTPASPDVLRALTQARMHDPELVGGIEARSPGEPHRQFLLLVAERVEATRQGLRLGYREPGQLLEDLRAAQRSLDAAGAARLAYGRLQELIWQVETFGFHLAELELRQHSTVHARALEEVRAGTTSPRTDEVLASLRVMAHLQRRYGVRACHRYVISFTRRSEDIAAVYELAEHACAGDPPVLDVVPLFETQEDLRAATSVLDAMLGLEQVQRRLERTGRRLEVMLGYSDSAKEAGPVSATLALFDAQADLAAWADRQRIRLTIFHGRGGALGRGGGPANRAVLAQAPGSVAGRFKVTEQGEVIFARYGHPAIARRHLEQVTSAVLLASSPEVEERNARAAARFRDLAGRIGEAAQGSYRELVSAPDFASWFASISPLEELGDLRIGSRPARRGGSRSLDDLRAIPWVFAWSQTRLNLPGWYGLGSGLAAAPLEELREAYMSWPLFSSLLDNAEMSLAKTDRRIAARYLSLGDRPELTERVLREYDLTVERVLAVTGHRRLLADRRVLSWAVELRNPYVDALSHLQLRALESLRAPGEKTERDRQRLQQLLLLTVNGVAAGLQNTG
jgi:phosphoenolpyruvate carboxylase